MEWLYPWWPTAEKGREFAATFERVLAREVGPGHPLYGVPAEAIGKHDGWDDVLFRLLDGSSRVAVVHLTWTRSLPERPPWPITQLYSSLEEWAETGMREDEYRDYSGTAVD
jgi:hypothetical protein